MFCEGFYLHRLIVRAFEIPKSLIIYYFIGIGEFSKSQIYLFWYLFLSIIYYFIGIGQWSTSYYKTTFSYIIHVLVFVYLIFNMFSKLPFYRPALREDQRWYRPFLDYTILISFKREFCIKISKKIQIVKLKDSDFFFFYQKTVYCEKHQFLNS